MRVTIIKDDSAVNVDGERHTVECADLPADFHALQWDGVHGEIEFAAAKCAHCGVRSKKHNLEISDLAPYQKYVDAWHVAKMLADAAREKALQEAAEKAQANAAGREG